MHADDETDEVYAQMTLQPLTPEEQNDTFLPMELGIPSKQPTNYFCKTLIASDTSTHGGFSVPRRAAEKIFPPLDSQNGTFLQQAGVYLLVPRGKASPSELVISLSKYIKDLMTSSPF